MILRIFLLTLILILSPKLCELCAVDVIMKNTSTEDIDFSNCKLEWYLDCQDKEKKIMPIYGEPIDLSRIKALETIELKGEYFQTGFEDSIFDRLTVYISKNNKILAETTKKLINTNKKGPIKLLALEVALYEHNDKPELDIYITNALFESELFEPELNSDSYRGNEYDRFFYFRDPDDKRLYFLMSHLDATYREAGGSEIESERKFLEENTKIRDLSKVNFKNKKIYDYKNEPLNVEGALYVLDGFGILRIMREDYIPAEFLTKKGKESEYFKKITPEDGPDYYTFTGGKRLFHSMLAASKAIACGGEIWVKDGIVTKIDNSSGHYAPSYWQLYLALDYLGLMGVLSKKTEVGFYNEKGKMEYLPYFEYTARGSDMSPMPNYPIKNESKAWKE